MGKSLNQREGLKSKLFAICCLQVSDTLEGGDQLIGRRLQRLLKFQEQ